MKVYSMQLGELMSNCYIIETAPGQCVAIDLGGSSARFLAFIREKQLKLNKILLTHGHFDHIGGVEEVRRATGAEVFIHADDAKMLTSAEYSLHRLISMSTFVPVEQYTAIESGCCITDGGCSFTIKHTPGHSEGSVCYFCEDCVFTGDTLFRGSCGRTDFPGSNPLDMENSLRDLYLVSEDLKVLPGHGEASTLSYEKKTNPYMKGFGKIYG